MSRKLYDPLVCIPSPDAIRDRLHETITLAERLRLLLEFAERLHQPTTPTTNLTASLREKDVRHG